MMYHIDFDIAAIVLYVGMIALYLKRPHIKDDMHRIYIALFSCALLTPVSDIISSVSISYKLNGALVIASTSLYYLFLQGVTFFFLFYVIYQLEQYQEIPRLKRFFLKVPVVLMVIMIISNDFTGFIFSYSVESGYKSGSLLWLFFAVSEAYFLWAIIYLTRHRKAFSKRFLLSFYNICFVNLISISVQYLIPTYMLISFGFAVSMVLLFLTAHTSNSGINIETKLMNREFFFNIADQLIRKKSKFSMILLRITDYDALTEIYGEKETQNLIKKIALKISSYVNVGEGFQISDNCFAVLIHDPKKAADVQSSFINNLNKISELQNQQIPFSMILTTINYPEKAHNISELTGYLQYFQKTKKYKHGIIPSEEISIRNLTRELEIENIIRNGIKNHLLEVYYQPICSANNQKFITAEALLRLKDSENNYINPDEFIPVAEHSGLMVSLGNYVLSEVCRFISENDMKQLGLNYIEVNLSVVQILQDNFIINLNEIITKYGVDKKYLCFEITETAANCSPEAFKFNLKKLVDEGFELALDDFGTGYGNLQRLIDTHFSIIKFDKNMTQKSLADDSLKQAFSDFIKVFHSLGYKVVAEGVETQEQYEYLKSSQMDYIQGFLFSKPLPELQFKKYILEHK